MNKSLIYASICLCIGSLAIADLALANGKPISNCPDADIMLSKQYPNFDLNGDCKGAYSNSGECDPNPRNSNLDDPSLAPDQNDPTSGWIIAGTNGKDIIHSTSLDDTICGGNGNDQIYGEGGDDIIYGDNGKDALYGGPGDDEIHGGNGKDYLSGYDDDHDSNVSPDPFTDDDTLYGENGKDDLSGGPGEDEIYGGNGKDSMDGGAGDDTISGDKGKDNCTDIEESPGINDCEDSDLEDGLKHH